MDFIHNEVEPSFHTIESMIVIEDTFFLFWVDRLRVFKYAWIWKFLTINLDNERDC